MTYNDPSTGRGPAHIPGTLAPGTLAPGTLAPGALAAGTLAPDWRSALLHRVSWGAILAGVVVTLVAQLILNMIGVGVGAATLNPMTGDNPDASTFSIGAGAWWVVSGILASLAGGYAAGQLSGKPDRSVSGWHGVTTWALSTLVIVYLLTSAAGGLIGGALGTVSGALGGAGRIVGTAAQTAAPSLASADNPFASIEQSVRGATGGTDPAALRDTAVQAVRAAVTGDAAQQAQAKENAAQALARAQTIPVDEARKRVDGYVQQYRQTLDQAKQTATAAADTAARVVARGSLLAAVALLLGLIASWLGAWLGTPRVVLSAVRDDRLG